jgi:hypothetical protein
MFRLPSRVSRWAWTGCGFIRNGSRLSFQGDIFHCALDKWTLDGKARHLNFMDMRVFIRTLGIKKVKIDKQKNPLDKKVHPI